jgi:hypothetical protein
LRRLASGQVWLPRDRRSSQRRLRISSRMNALSSEVPMHSTTGRPSLHQTPEASTPHQRDFCPENRKNLGWSSTRIYNSPAHSIERIIRAWRMRPMVQRNKRNASAVETYGFASLKRRQLGKRFEHTCILKSNLSPRTWYVTWIVAETDLACRFAVGVLATKLIEFCAPSAVS